MKKIILPLVIIVLLLTGCSIVKLNSLSLDEIVDYSLSNTYKANNSFKGYKIYLPNDMTIINDEKENNVFYSKGHKYYLYVDIISYYKKIVNDYKINEDEKAFCSKIINHNGNKGYVLITKQDNNYFLEVMYNYSKIEVITDNYKESLFKSITILNNIKYNDKIIESLIGENTINYNEEEYSYLNPSKNTSSFLEWKEMYGDYKPEPNEIPDEDTIDIKKDE